MCSVRFFPGPLHDLWHIEIQYVLFNECMKFCNKYIACAQVRVWEMVGGWEQSHRNFNQSSQVKSEDHSAVVTKWEPQNRVTSCTFLTKVILSLKFLCSLPSQCLQILQSQASKWASLLNWPSNRKLGYTRRCWRQRSWQRLHCRGQLSYTHSHRHAGRAQPHQTDECSSISLLLRFTFGH